MSAEVAPTTVGPAMAGSSYSWVRVAAATFAIAWGGNEFTPLLGMYRRTDGFSAVEVDILLFAYVIGIVPAMLIAGPLSNRTGRRPFMLAAPLLAAAGSLVLGCGDGSVPVLMVGRILSGVALGIAMVVGGTWIDELSSPPWGVGAGARRAGMSLTAGFGAGAGTAGVLAQWMPWPTTVPYAVQIVLSLLVFVALLAAPETRAAQADRSALSDLKITGAGHPRFLVVVLPLAPWVFGAASSAYAVMPALMVDRSGGTPIAFSALLCAVALACGFAIQPLGQRIDSPTSPRAVIVTFLTLIVGMAVAAWAAHSLTIGLAVLAAALLGCGYGLALVAGLLELQRIAAPDDLAGMTAVFYCISYLGFAIPTLLAVLSQMFPGLLTYQLMFAAGAIAATLCICIVVMGSRQLRPLSGATTCTDSG